MAPDKNSVHDAIPDLTSARHPRACDDVLDPRARELLTPAMAPEKNSVHGATSARTSSRLDTPERLARTPSASPEQLGRRDRDLGARVPEAPRDQPPVRSSPSIEL